MPHCRSVTAARDDRSGKYKIWMNGKTWLPLGVADRRLSPDSHLSKFSSVVPPAKLGLLAKIVRA